jgi:hypothetical protein
MSYIRRIEPEPDPLGIILAELTDIWHVLELLSLRLARLEARQPGNRPQTRPEAQS